METLTHKEHMRRFGPPSTKQVMEHLACEINLLRLEIEKLNSKRKKKK